MANVVRLRGDFVTLSQALKVAGMMDSGGQAKQIVRGGNVKVNGAIELKPGRKLRAGDRFDVGGEEWVIEA